MKRLTKIIVMTLITAIISCGISYQQAEAKNIYFSGEYVCKKGIILSLSEYSGPTPGEVKRHEVGTFQFDVPHAYNAYNGILVKTGKNKYRSKKKGLNFRVYKKKVVIKVSGKKYDKDLKGTYKLYRHFYS